MSPARVEYATPPALVAALALACAGALFVALDAAPAGRFLAGVVAVVAGAEALRSGLLRPTLAFDADGIEVVSGLTRERHPWPAVVSVAPMSPPSGGGRLRRRAAALEIDLGERLLVLPAYRLGAPVDQVAAAALSSAGGTWGGF